MPLVRLTPENAVETVRDQVAAFRQTIAAAGRSPALERLEEQADDLLRVIGGPIVEVELLLLDGIAPRWTAPLATWLGVELEMLSRASDEGADLHPAAGASEGIALAAIRRGARSAGRRAGERTPPVLVVAHGGAEAPPQELVREIVDDMRGRPLTLLLALPSADWARALAGLGSRDSWTAKLIELDQLDGLSLAQNLSRPPWDQACRFACAWSVAGGLASLERAFSVVLEKEERGLAANKAALEKRTAQPAASSNPTEILGEVRGYLQKHFDGFQKRVAAELGALMAPHDGSLTREIEDRISQLRELEVEKKAKVDVVTIPKSFEKELFARASGELGGLLQSQWSALRQLVEDARVQIESILERKGGPPVALHFAHLPEQRAGAIVQRAVQVQKPYRGEITRKGPMDYFMAARRYQMLFFMVFSAFGLSFIRSYREFAIPAGVLLLAFGLLNVVNAARKQRGESDAKELGKARDGLRADLQRGMSEVQKNWEQTISGHLAAQQAAALETVDSTLKAVAERAAREAASGKELLQQQMRGLDGMQRKIVEGMRKAQATAQDLEALGPQLIEFYGRAIRPGDGAGPGRAGVAAGGAGGARPAAAAGGAAAAAAAAGAAAAAKLAALGVKVASPGAVSGPPRPAAAGAGAGSGAGADGVPTGSRPAAADSAADPVSAAAAAAAAAAARMQALGVGGGAGSAPPRRAGAPSAPPAGAGDALARLRAEAAEKMAQVRQRKPVSGRERSADAAPRAAGAPAPAKAPGPVAGRRRPDADPAAPAAKAPADRANLRQGDSGLRAAAEKAEASVSAPRGAAPAAPAAKAPAEPRTGPLARLRAALDRQSGTPKRGGDGSAGTPRPGGAGDSEPGSGTP